MIWRFFLFALVRRLPFIRKAYLRYTNDMRWARCSVCGAHVDYGRYVPGFIRYSCSHKPALNFSFVRRFFL